MPVVVQHGVAARPHEAHVDGLHPPLEEEEEPLLDPLAAPSFDEPEDEPLLEAPPLDDEEDDSSIDGPPSLVSASGLSSRAPVSIAEPASATTTGPLSAASSAPASGIASGVASKSPAVNGAPPQPRRVETVSASKRVRVFIG